MKPGWQPSLPGLTVPTQAPTSGRLHEAAVATLRALDEADVLQPEHAITAQLILDLSSALDIALRSGHLSVAASQGVRQLLDAIASLPTIERAAEVDEAWAQFEEALRKA